MRILAFPSINAYLNAIPFPDPHPFTLLPSPSLAPSWVMTLSLQHALLIQPYPMESVQLHPIEEGPLRHLEEARGDTKKAEEEALASAQARLLELQSAGKVQEGTDKEKVKELRDKRKEMKEADKKSKRETSELQEALRLAQERVKQLEATITVASKATV
jgi:hypothetical protein